MINIDKIIQIESSGRPDVVSDKGAIGLMQITPIALKDYNQRYGTQFTINDLRDEELNRVIGDNILELRIPEQLKAKGLPDCDFLRLVSYNAGIVEAKRVFESLPTETKNYLKKYFEVEVL